MLMVAASVVAATLVVHVDADEFAHAVYNVVCLAHQVPCTAAKYERLWKDELKWSAEDQTELDRWQSMLSAIKSRAPVESDAPLLADYLSFYPYRRQESAILSAALEAKSAAAFQARVSSVVTVDEARAMARVLHHFETRLHPWWQRVGRRRVPSLRATERQFSPAVQGLLHQVGSFVHADPRVTDLHMHVVPSPYVENDDASGTVVGSHFFLELVPPTAAGAAKDRAARMVASVAVHELTHALYDSAPLLQHLAIMGQFVGSSDRGAPSMFAFLNEAIASAVQQMALDLGPDDDAVAEGEYRHPYIPRLARAAAAPLTTALTTGTTITDGFVEAYVREARQVLGAEADSLAFRFGAMAILASEATRPAIASLRETVKPTYDVDTVLEWQRAGELSAAFLRNYDEVREFADRIPALTELMRHRGFAFVLPYKTRSYLLVLAGRDAAAVGDVIRRLEPENAVPGEGVVVTIE
ncbi:MAG TPA: hypothetical protein VH417_20210 [Vicinamibacterales bacterium]|jgi:hypothetical protein